MSFVQNSTADPLKAVLFLVDYKRQYTALISLVKVPGQIERKTATNFTSQ